MAQVGMHRDSWGNDTTGCEAIRELGRTTWALCGKDAVAIGVYGDGSTRRICKGHVAGALRKRTFYSNDIVEIRDLNGNTVHTLVRTSGRNGYMKGVA